MMRAEEYKFKNEAELHSFFQELQVIDESFHNELSPWERNFVSSMVERYKKYGKDTFVSTKQFDAATRIIEEKG